MWERFSYYGMRAFLILYMVAPAASGGLGFADADAASIYGTYTGSVWGAAILGGIVADRFLGQYRSVLIGGIIIALGHFTLAFKALPFFYTGLALIVVGTGLLKPNVSTLVGSLYAPGDARRDAGFSIFYMGINLGAFLGPLDRRLSRAAGRLALGFASRRRRHGASAWRSTCSAASACSRHSSGWRRKPTRAAPRRRPHRRAGPAALGFTTAEWKRIGAIVDLLPLRDPVLGRLRAGRLDAESLRRSLHAARAVRVLVPVVVVPDRCSRSSSSCSRRCSPGSGCGSGRASRRCRRSSRSACCSWACRSWCSCRPARWRRAARASASARVAGRRLLRLGARRALPQPGRPERGHQARAASASSA